MTAEELKRVFLTHIHLDHAGVTGHLAERAPGLQVVVHEEGAPHLADPERLVRSTRRTFGDEAHERLWGEVRPLREGQLRPWRPGLPSVAGLLPIPTPGHIAHHLAYLDQASGTLFSGDALGILLAPGAPVHPPTPPPSLDAAAWALTLRMLEEVEATRIAAAHFGFHDDPRGRAAELAARLEELVAAVAAARSAGDGDAGARYERAVRDRLAPSVGRAQIERYFDTFPAETDWKGVVLYLERLERQSTS